METLVTISAVTQSNNPEWSYITYAGFRDDNGAIHPGGVYPISNFDVENLKPKAGDMMYITPIKKKE